ncbi:MAG: hypothetical protein E7199_07740 [Schwartzia succinivorans]|nr:hypothetical protein [Schwartzia succinivorans]
MGRFFFFFDFVGAVLSDFFGGSHIFIWVFLLVFFFFLFGLFFLFFLPDVWIQILFLFWERRRRRRTGSISALRAPTEPQASQPFG